MMSRAPFDAEASLGKGAKRECPERGVAGCEICVGILKMKDVLQRRGAWAGCDECDAMKEMKGEGHGLGV